MLYDSIYTKFKYRLNSSKKVEARVVVTGDVHSAWERPQCGMWGAANVMLLDLRAGYRDVYFVKI